MGLGEMGRHRTSLLLAKQTKLQIPATLVWRRYVCSH